MEGSDQRSIWKLPAWQRGPYEEETLHSYKVMNRIMDYYNVEGILRRHVAAFFFGGEGRKQNTAWERKQKSKNRVKNRLWSVRCAGVPVVMEPAGSG